jgi:hypothetical protein
LFFNPDREIPNYKSQISNKFQIPNEKITASLMLLEMTGTEIGNLATDEHRCTQMSGTGEQEREESGLLIFFSRIPSNPYLCSSVFICGFKII